MSKKTPPTASWAAALQQEIANPQDDFGPGWKSFEEIRQELKEAGLSYGPTATRHWLKKLRDSGRCDMRDGSVRNKEGLCVRATKYFLKT